MPLMGVAMNMETIRAMAFDGPKTERMPVLFLGHGSPMNAIEDNAFVREFRSLAASIPTPAAVLCVSAHWETKGTLVTAMEAPRTIHDFGGFPPELYRVQYPAPGSPQLAAEARTVVTGTEIGLDDSWGLDHGTWSVVKHLYPKADVPVLQLSLDRTKGPAYHYALAKELAPLRRRGVLIIGSGNMVHNLRMVAWDKLSVPGFGFDWALEARAAMNAAILSGDHDRLVRFGEQGAAFRLAIPTPEHFLPLLYILALQEPGEQPLLFNDEALGGSLTMTSVKIG